MDRQFDAEFSLQLEPFIVGRLSLDVRFVN